MSAIIKKPFRRPRPPKSSARRGGMKIAMWGNCMAVRIPKMQARQIGLCVGTEVVVESVPDGILIRPARRRMTLKELVAKITPANRHGEIDLGAPVGREVI